jgi:hypothetical protein
MAFEEGRDTLICEHCGAKHKARWYRLPVREEQSIRCKRAETSSRKERALGTISTLSCATLRLALPAAVENRPSLVFSPTDAFGNQARAPSGARVFFPYYYFFAGLTSTRTPK